ncbi:MAG: thioredoxin family protein [Holosporaceae bacterium]|nr:thioredoxin family protein [Holosporaceae bacterium]
MMFFFSLLFLLSFDAKAFVKLEIFGNIAHLEEETFCGELTLVIPDGWQLAKAPDISLTVSRKSLEHVGNLKQLDKNTYMVNYRIPAEGILGNALTLRVDCPLCQDICTIVSKTIEISLNREFHSQTTSHRGKIFQLLVMILLGFVGGAVLNVMPCVLPVIMLKLRSLTSRNAIGGAIAGNYASFLSFGICLAVMKMAGEGIGWGMHLQNPYFLEVIMLVLFILTLYSFGLVSWFPSMRMDGREFWGSFLSSIVATIIAIPCTAPFLGTAAAFAIQGSVPELLAVFFSIATGFSLPYFLSFCIPVEKITVLTRVSPIFKKIVNCGVLLTFLWFFWLLSRHLRSMTVLVYGISLTGSALLLKIRQHRSAFTILVIFCCWEHYIDFTGKESSSRDILTRLETERIQKRLILFNITADWCLTCKYNRRWVLDSLRVRESLKNNHAVFIEADMTKRDEALMQFIRTYNRAGIPFTIVYGQGAPEGILLNESLSESAVVDALKKAR